MDMQQQQHLRHSSKLLEAETTGSSTWSRSWYRYALAFALGASFLLLLSTPCARRRLQLTFPLGGASSVIFNALTDTNEKTVTMQIMGEEGQRQRDVVTFSHPGLWQLINDRDTSPSTAPVTLRDGNNDTCTLPDLPTEGIPPKPTSIQKGKDSNNLIVLEDKGEAEEASLWNISRKIKSQKKVFLYVNGEQTDDKEKIGEFVTALDKKLKADKCCCLKRLDVLKCECLKRDEARAKHVHDTLEKKILQNENVVENFSNALSNFKTNEIKAVNDMFKEDTNMDGIPIYELVTLEFTRKKTKSSKLVKMRRKMGLLGFFALIMLMAVVPFLLFAMNDGDFDTSTDDAGCGNDWLTVVGAFGAACILCVFIIMINQSWKISYCRHCSHLCCCTDCESGNDYCKKNKSNDGKTNYCLRKKDPELTNAMAKTAWSTFFYVGASVLTMAGLSTVLQEEMREDIELFERSIEIMADEETLTDIIEKLEDPKLNKGTFEVFKSERNTAMITGDLEKAEAILSEDNEAIGHFDYIKHPLRKRAFMDKSNMTNVPLKDDMPDEDSLYMKAGYGWRDPYRLINFGFTHWTKYNDKLKHNENLKDEYPKLETRNNGKLTYRTPKVSDEVMGELKKEFPGTTQDYSETNQYSMLEFPDGTNITKATRELDNLGITAHESEVKNDGWENGWKVVNIRGEQYNMGEWRTHDDFEWADNAIRVALVFYVAIGISMLIAALYGIIKCVCLCNRDREGCCKNRNLWPEPEKGKSLSSCQFTP